MRIIVVGYGNMFTSVLSGLLNTKHDIIAVFRHESVLYNPIKKIIFDILNPTYEYNFIKTHKLHEIKAQSVNSEAFIKQVKELNADLIITASWSEKFLEETINSPKIACINVHPSLLPKYRGPNPYLQTILRDEQYTGVTFHLMDKGFDSGDILHQAQVPISNTDTGLTLKNKCCEVARIEIQNLLNNFDEKYKNKRGQDPSKSSYYSHIKLSESILDFKKETTEQIDRRIRALSPWLNCHITYKNQFFTFKSHKIHKEISNKEPSTIVKKTKHSISVVCADGNIIEFFELKSKQPLLNIFCNNYIKVNEKAL